MIQFSIETPIVAALISLFGVIFAGLIAYIATGENNRRSAIRSLINSDIQRLGNLLYYAVAIGKKMINASSDESFKILQKEAEKCRNELNEVRGLVRYSLWGIDDGIKQIRSVPFYCSHYRGNQKDGEFIIKNATKLRESIDKSILYSFFQGKPPTFLQKVQIKIYIWKLKRSFERNSPSK